MYSKSQSQPSHQSSGVKQRKPLDTIAKLWSTISDSFWPWWSFVIGEDYLPLPGDVKYDDKEGKALITKSLVLTALKTQVESYAESVSKLLLKSREAETSKHNVAKWLSQKFAESLESELMSSIDQNDPKDTINQNVTKDKDKDKEAIDDCNEKLICGDKGIGCVDKDELFKVMKSTCIIKPPNGGQGTGFFADRSNKPTDNSSTLLITSKTLLPSEKDAKSSKVILHGEEIPVALSELLVDNSFKCSTPDKEAQLDYVIMEVNLDRKYTKINVSQTAKIKDGDFIYLFQHSTKSNAVYMSSSECFVYDRFVVYESKTDPGSPGSPIMKENNVNLEIVGIHKAGDKESELFNMGVLFSEILSDYDGKDLKPNDYRLAEVTEKCKDHKGLIIQKGQKVNAKKIDDDNIEVCFGGECVIIPINKVKWLEE